MGKRSKRLKLLPTAARHVYLNAYDALQNRRFAGAKERFLIVRHARKKPFFYNILLKWLEQNFPEVRARFELHTLPHRLRDTLRGGGNYVLHIPWLQDPVQNWSATAYRQANELASECDERGIAVINRVDKLVNAAKSTGARVMRNLGIRTPKMVLIQNVKEFQETHGGLKLPLFVRENWGHGGEVYRADTPAELRQIPLAHFSRPVAIELIDVQSQDGLYRKYRYVAAGERGIAQTMHVGNGWKVKGTGCENSNALHEEEMAYTNQPDPNHRQLQAAREALGLDFAAFDYSYDRTGRMVVWEANPYPYIHFPSDRRSYRQTPIIRSLAAMAELYLERAALAVPQEINELLEPAANPNLSVRIHAASSEQGFQRRAA